jgi:hypothetical protein
MNIKNSIKTLALAGVGFTMTSCGDFLDLLPLNEIVVENYWQEESDVESVVKGCYAQLASEACVSRMIAWGEMRADNVIKGNSPSTDVQNILKGNLLSTSGYTNWTSFYQCINYCNTVIKYAPQVAEKDPNYTEGEMRATIAEMTALRSLCYFYLIRAFKDVPYVTEPSIDDSQNYIVGATDFNTILKSSIDELEAVVNNLILRYPESASDSSNPGNSDHENTSRFTRVSGKALLADMYLMLASDADLDEATRKSYYNKCIEYCDAVITYKWNRYVADYNGSTQFYKFMEEQTDSVTGAKYGIALLRENRDNSTTTSGYGYAQDALFGDGNCFESLFELNYRDGYSAKNDAIVTYYGGTDETYSTYSKGCLYALEDLYTNLPTSSNDIFSYTDCRVYANVLNDDQSYYIGKYVVDGITSLLGQPSTTLATTDIYSSVNSGMRKYQHYSNWIIYRLTDVILMKAEALCQLAGSGASYDSSAELQDAFALVKTVYDRANWIYSANGNTKNLLDASSYKDGGSMASLVLLERRRELMFEGKRWFDLLRVARRDGDMTQFKSYVLQKYSTNSTVMNMRFSNYDAIFWPYNKDELKVNTELKQKSFYSNEEDSFDKN